MQRTLHFLFMASLALLLASPAQAWIRSPATTFATLPSGATPPEGITVDKAGDVYVSTFGFPEAGPSANPGQIVVFDAHGKLLRQFPVATASPHLLGLAFHPTTNALLVLDFGFGKVLNVDPTTGALISVFADISGAACSAFPADCTSPNGVGLNALTFDAAGNVYISDSFNGVIWQTPPGGGSAVPWIQDALLTTTGKPPFGANGLAFDSSGTTLFVANTGDDTVVKIPVSGGAPLGPTVLAYSINGADGLIMDANDNLWVAANQSDEIVVLDPTGKVIAKLGDFEGIDNQGAARGLLFPASLVFSGNSVLVTNLVLDTRPFGFSTLDTAWTAQVTRYTVSKINAHLPPISPAASAPGHGPAGHGPPSGHGH